MTLRTAGTTIIERLSLLTDRLHPLPVGCTLLGQQGIPGYAVPGCACPSLDNGVTE